MGTGDMTDTSEVAITWSCCGLTEINNTGTRSITHHCKRHQSTFSTGIEFKDSLYIDVEKAEYQKERKDRYREWRKDLKKKPKNWKYK